MRKIILQGILMMGFSSLLEAQVGATDTTSNVPTNSAQNIIASDKTFTIGGYGQIDFNKTIVDTLRTNGVLDVHRVVVFMGYKFSDKVHFVSELEFEHVKEVGVEQAFINYKISEPINFRAGLMLIPMGIVNEYHETTTFNGVERTAVETKIIPTTWRELGVGFTGNIDNLALKYQVYVINGFKSYDNGGKLRGIDGLRKGRQEGMESIISSPNFASKIDFYGIKGLKLGLAGYFGNTQSTLYNNLATNDTSNFLANQADSSVIGLAMVGFDFRYTYRAFQARGVMVYASINNSKAYNLFTGKDIGSSMFGYYAEIGYNILSLLNKDAKQKLVAFGRYEFYNTQNTVTNETIKNDAFARTDITFGLSYHIANGVAFKGDYQIRSNNIQGSKAYNQLNLGIGFWF